MRIGLIAPPWLAVPPPRYGGTEAVVDGLARGLADLGHEVRLFTVGTSTCPVGRAHVFEREVEPMGRTVPEAAHVLAAYEGLGDVDVIHDHTVLGPLLGPRVLGGGPPVVVTNHGPFTALTRPIFREIARSAAVVAISQDQASRAGVPVAAVIHHGIDLEAHRWGPGDGGYLAFVGRMSPEKGVDAALRIARASGLPLRMSTKMRDPEEVEYFECSVRPLLTPDVQLELELTLPERVDLLRHAVALLNPIAWDEPFGLVMAESLACGTPVVTTPRGAAPEIVRSGYTGFLCPGEECLVDAVRAATDLSRAACRAEAEAHFSLERMAEDHEAFYLRVLEGEPLAGGPASPDVSLLQESPAPRPPAPVRA